MNSVLDHLDLTSDLRAQARSLEDLGVNERAWPRTAALAVLSALNELPIAVLGGDVLRSRDGVLEYTYDNWHSDQRQQESFDDYAARSQAEAQQYITAYPTAAADPQFVLVLQDLGPEAQNTKTP